MTKRKKEKLTKNIVSKKDFANLCGGVDSKPVSMTTIYSDIKRDKIEVLSNGKIDVDNPVNSEYVRNRRSSEKTKAKVKVIEVDREKKQIEKLQAEENLRIAQIKRQKLEGELIPTDLVKNIFSTHFRTYTQSFHNAAEQIAVDLVKKLGGSREDTAWAKGQLVITINNAVKKGRDLSKQEVDVVVKEYSQTKGRGNGIY